MTSVKDGGFYGWPYSYYGQHVDPRVQPQRPDLVAKAIVPDYALSSHVAPLGHGLQHRRERCRPPIAAAPSSASTAVGTGSVLNGYKVVFVPFTDGKPSGTPQDVVTGFLNSDNQARGRPVGVAIDKTGALLVADDSGNTVWRVTAAHPQLTQR